MQGVLGIVLGSGLGPLAERVVVSRTADFAELGLPVSKVKGHAGRFLFGKLGQREVIVMQGRVHLYEGKPAADVGRLTELLVRATLREHLKQIALEHHGWLDGLRDRHVARCLSLIHRHFSEPIDMLWLSREVGLSRSALHDRFVCVLGEPPMRYCTRWRLRHAAHLLRDTTANTASVAYAAGYNSEAAFNRAFKREYGEPPAAWRRRKAEAMRPGPGLSRQ